MLETNMKDKVILVTGATSGMGETVAKRFVNEGAKVVAIGRNEEKLQMLEYEHEGQVLSYRYDLSDLENIEDIFLFCKENQLKLDGLVHCAGMVCNNPIRTIDYHETEKIMRVNCFSFMEMGKWFSKRKYSKDGSSMVAISSVESILNDKGLVQYSASKAALNSVVKTMAKEVMKRQIRVNAILPSYVETAMTQATAQQISDYEKQITHSQPLGRIEPEYIAGLVEYLLSDYAKYMTGELVVMGGGNVSVM
ncbi:MAG: SDR family oxidoreductase [Eubacterium sp.]|mgnify:FL=1|nr:SDR family oxidoreductase [Eubacterium sp.]